VLQHWIAAIRPRTLPVAVAPVIVGTCLAWADGYSLSLAVMAAAILAATMIQIGTNLHNDVADFERGGDDPLTRLGPRRATAEGWLTAAAVKAAARLSFAAAAFCGAYLISVGGWPILVVGLLSIVAGYSYSGGPRPISYTPLGELFVWLFFGVVAVAGSYYLQAMHLPPRPIIAGAILGLPAAAVLAVNNYRDLDNDRRVGRSTFAVVFGRNASRVEYALLMLLPFAAVPLLETLSSARGWLPFAALPWALLLVRRFCVDEPGPRFNILLASTAKFQLALSALTGVAVTGGASPVG
jgi:1,4-dihydroxy-2-naphthoate octaprenyltransferase